MILGIALITIVTVGFVFAILCSKSDGSYLEDDVKREKMWRRFDGRKKS